MKLHSKASIFFSEHLLSQDEILSIKIPIYTMAACFTRKNIHHDGVRIFVKDSLRWTEMKDLKQKKKDRILECCGKILNDILVIVIDIYTSGYYC